MADVLELEFFRHFLLSRRAGALIRTIAWISMVGVTLGVFSLVVVISVMNGFHDAIRKRLLAAEPHLVIRMEQKGADRQFVLPENVQTLLRDHGATFNLVEKQDVVIRTSEGIFSGAEAKGLDPEAARKLIQDVNEANRDDRRRASDVETPELSEETLSLGPGEIVMGTDLARGLDISFGDRITVLSPEALLMPAGEVPKFERVLVKSLITTNVADLDTKLMIFSRGATLQRLGDAVSRRFEFEVWLKNAKEAEKVKSEIWKLQPELKVSTWGERNSSLFQALHLEIIAIGLFLSLSAMIAGFSIVTVLMILVMQKRKEIGLLMSLGLSRARTQQLFSRVGLLLSSVGIILGSVLGVIVCMWIDSNKTSILPEFYYDTTIPAKVNPLFVLAVVLIALGLGWVASWAPVRRITSMEPAEALRSFAQKRGEAR